MKTGISSYSFAKLMRGGMSYIQAAKTAKDIGYDVFEVQALAVPEGVDRDNCAKELAAYCAEIGIEISHFTVDADLLTGSFGNFDAEVERVQKEIDIAVLLGAKGIRHDMSRGYETHTLGNRFFDDAVPRIAEGCRKITEYAAIKGVKTMVENHGYFSQDSERVEKVLSAVNHENFGLLLDMGNFLCADEAPEKAFGKLAPFAFHVHAKDFHVKSGLLPNPGKGWFASRAGNYLCGTVVGFGDVPVLQCLSILKKSGYDGVVSVEFEGNEDNLFAVEVAHENLRKFISQA